MDQYNLKESDLVYGSIYVAYYEGQGDYIFRYNRGCWLNVNDRVFEPTGGRIGVSNGFHKFRHAEYHEKIWLWSSLYMKKFVSKSEAIEIYDSRGDGRYYRERKKNLITDENMSKSCIVVGLKFYNAHSWLVEVTKVINNSVYLTAETGAKYTDSKSSIIERFKTSQYSVRGLENYKINVKPKINNHGERKANSSGFNERDTARQNGKRFEVSLGGCGNGLEPSDRTRRTRSVKLGEKQRKLGKGLCARRRLARLVTIGA